MKSLALAFALRMTKTTGEVLIAREKTKAGAAEAVRLREAVVAEQERANAALKRAMEAEARLAATTPARDNEVSGSVA